MEISSKLEEIKEKRMSDKLDYAQREVLRQAGMPAEVSLNAAQRDLLRKAGLPAAVPALPPDAPAPGTTRPHETPPHPETPTSAGSWADINRRAIALVQSGEAPDFSTAFDMLRPALYEQHRRVQLYGNAGINRPGISAADAAGIPGTMGKQAGPDEPVAELEARLLAVIEKTGLPRPEAWGRVMKTADGIRLYQSYLEGKTAERRS
jgi:hypothetical protein